MSEKTLLFIPTLNEKGNLNRMLKILNNIHSKIDLLIIDDNSSDGTNKEFENSNDILNKKIIIRKDKNGIGSTHLDAIRYAINNKYKFLLTMDCDFTHDPLHIEKDFIPNAEFYSFIVGSRFLRKDSLIEWSLIRRILTNITHFITKFILGIKFDTTSGYRLYNLKYIDENFFKEVIANDYSFFIESGFYIHTRKLSFLEIPLILPKRSIGHSKLRLIHIIIALKLVAKLFIIRIFKIR